MIERVGGKREEGRRSGQCDGRTCGKRWRERKKVCRRVNKKLWEEEGRCRREFPSRPAKGLRQRQRDEHGKKNAPREE
jgi:hypothetical protein